jgi:SAM-dependent methyltransferase
MMLESYRISDQEQTRIRQLMSLVPARMTSILDVGTRDGYIARQLAQRGHRVTALDLELPLLNDDRITCVQGDVTDLHFASDTFELVLCAEVLEHLRPQSLAAACSELQRVARTYLLIGVPFDQDIRYGRTTCYTCKSTNPPWSHIHRFTTQSLRALFPTLTVEYAILVGQQLDYTNALSAMLLDIAGNPFGTYAQDEPCVHCGSRLLPPPDRTLLQRVCTRVAVKLNETQNAIMPKKPAWIHVLFRKQPAASAGVGL